VINTQLCELWDAYPIIQAEGLIADAELAVADPKAEAWG
jgi:hypothetical protein